MRFASVAALFGLVASVLAQDALFDPVYTPGSGEEVPVGKPYVITWTAQPAGTLDDLLLIELIGGATQGTQVPLYVVATGVKNSDNQYTWTPNSDEFGKNFYGLRLTNLNSVDQAQFQYSNPFKLVSDVAATTTTTTDVTAPTVTPVTPVTTTPTPTDVSTGEESTGDEDEGYGNDDDESDYDDEDCEETGTVPVVGGSVPTTVPVPAVTTSIGGARPTMTTSYHAAASTSVTAVIPTIVPGAAVAKSASLALAGAAAAFALLI